MGCFRSCRTGCVFWAVFWFCPLEEALIPPRKPVIFVFQIFMPPSESDFGSFLLVEKSLFSPILLVPQWFFRAVEREEMNQCGGSSGLHESVSELQGNVLLSSCSPCTQSSLHGREEVEPGGLAMGLEGEFCSTYRCLGGFQ